MRVLYCICIVGLLLVFPQASDATLFDRGNGMFYDDTLNVTWLDEFLYLGSGEVGDIQYLIGQIDTTGHGTTTLFQSSYHVSHVDVNNRGFTDWRLPTIVEYSVLGSYLQNNNPSPFHNLAYWGNPNASQPYWDYWSSDYVLFQNQHTSHNLYFTYNFTNDSINLRYPATHNAPGLAVRDGDVLAPVPEPGTIVLFALGFFLLLGNIYRHHRATRFFSSF